MRKRYTHGTNRLEGKIIEEVHAGVNGSPIEIKS